MCVGWRKTTFYLDEFEFDEQIGTDIFEIAKVKLRRSQHMTPGREMVASNAYRFAVVMLPVTKQKRSEWTRVDHPHVVQVHGEGHDGFLVIDRMICSLQDCIDEWATRSIPPSMEERVQIIGCISSAVSYLHQNEIVHGAVNAQNVGFDMDGNVRLCWDFSTSLVRGATSKETDTQQFLVLLKQVIELKPKQPRDVSLLENTAKHADTFYGVEAIIRDRPDNPGEEFLRLWFPSYPESCEVPTMEDVHQILAKQQQPLWDSRRQMAPRRFTRAV